MTYIVLDLEWNQAYLQKALAVQKRIGCHLRGEVIQIGAVKLDDRFRIAGSYSLIVRPRFFPQMHRHVARLTGISQEMVNNGAPLPEAIERFHRFCGDDAVFLTWGPDDIPLLKDNLWAHRISAGWLNRVYDLQRIFNRQTDGINRQRSLEYAMEHFSLPQNLPAHDALNDAYFTARVAQKLDIARGIREYAVGHNDALQDITYGESDIGQEGYVSAEAALSDTAVSVTACPLCGAAVEYEGRKIHTKGQRYQSLVHCAEHGDFFVCLRPARNFDETWRVRKSITRASGDELVAFREKLREPERRRVRRPRRHRRPSAAQGTTPPTDQNSSKGL